MNIEPGDKCMVINAGCQYPGASSFCEKHGIINQYDKRKLCNYDIGEVVSVNMHDGVVVVEMITEGYTNIIGIDGIRFMSRPEKKFVSFTDFLKGVR